MAVDAAPVNSFTTCKNAESGEENNEISLNRDPNKSKFKLPLQSPNQLMTQRLNKAGERPLFTSAVVGGAKLWLTGRDGVVCALTLA